jgi:protein-S-isoprenylcysteine O-methyltransferase Ste14
MWPATKMIQPIELVGGAWTAFSAYWVVQGVRAKRPAVKEPLGDRVAHLAMMAAAAYLIAADDPRLGKLNERFLPDAAWIGLLGVVLTFAGVAFAIWARHHIGRYWSARVSIVTEHKLIRTGPYAHIRHPIYTGILLGLAGTALVAGEYRAMVGLALALYGFARKAQKEEAFLAAQFGADFDEHRRHTGFFLPKFY